MSEMNINQCNAGDRHPISLHVNSFVQEIKTESGINFMLDFDSSSQIVKVEKQEPDAAENIEGNQNETTGCYDPCQG